MTREAFALALVGVVAVAAAAAIPFALYLVRDAHRMARAVEQLDAPNGRRTVARAHVRAARLRVVLAAVTTAKAMLLGVILANARTITPAVLAFVVLYATSKVVLAVDAAMLSRDRLAILRASQRRG